MKILIVIVNYNGKHLLEKNLHSVVENGYEDSDIVVVDNASVDGSIEYLKQEFPSVKIVESRENLGFGRGNNLGVKEYPNYDAYLFLNNDISVPKGFLDNLVKELQKENVGAVGPKVLYSKEKVGSEKRIINSAGIEVDDHYMAYDRYDKEEDKPKYNVVEEVDALMGGAFLIKRDVFEKVGGFNSNMFLYYEDIDLSLRIRDLGYKLYYVGTSEVYHDHMASSKSLGTRKRNIMNMQNRFRSIQSRKGIWVAIREVIWYLFNWLVWKMIYSRRITLKEFLKEK
ncbi:TPA: glycosyltransferase family 2 protein [Candidatus Dojkabacteria bacterium]|jgi:GT2 family glycosyltransferase|uniref:Glycosyltransferase family 2 protein n=1 Tax=Candidatus Dojkabacteria bacterium TaxID=2099670 RepID=A0A832QD83_9BACT|nr:glycosyltransferase family 2 protein [Candidatus Dojkabacteria bacterium]